MKAKSISTLIAPLLLTFSLHTFAQQAATVGELLDKGGKKLTKDEVAKLIPGATIGGIIPRFPNMKSDHTYKDDGSVSGNVVRVTGGGPSTATGVFGKWSVNEQGQICTDLRDTRGGSFQNCNFYFRLGDAYYVATTDDKMAQIFEREVKR
jgi:hypothetical protein